MSWLQKTLLIIFSVIISFTIFEVILRVKNYPPQLNSEFYRRDLKWTSEQVELNSFGYRDREYKQDKNENGFRIYTIGDSYTYGWLIDDPQDTYTKIIEKKLSNKLKRGVEVINAGSPGFTIKEEIDRFINEGKFFYPDLVLIGINDEEPDTTSTYFRPSDLTFPQFIKNSRVYQATLGNYFGKIAEKKFHDFLQNIYENPNSKDWKEFEAYIIKLKEEASKINSKLAILVFPHVHPNNPNIPYDLYSFNKKFEELGKKLDIIIIDPLDKFLKHPDKKRLVINPLDPHPTVEMNFLVADEFLRQFDIEEYFSNHQEYFPQRQIVSLDQSNNEIGAFQHIVKIDSNIPGYPWVYFETINESNSQSFPLVGKEFRKTKFQNDYLQTAKSFIHAGLPGATITYHQIPSENGVIKISRNIYGFEIIGVSQILALRAMENGATKGDYISPASIKREGDEWVVKYDQKENYQLYKLNLKVAIRQLDINKHGEVENISQTQEFKQIVSSNTDKVTFSLKDKTFSWIRFEDFQGGGFDYALVNNKASKLKSVSSDDKTLTLVFDKPISKGSEVSFFTTSKYQHAPGEKIQIEME